LQTLSGLDLKVGGEGMKGFYDRMLVAAANKLVKKYGARVEPARMWEGNPEAWKAFRRSDGQWALRHGGDAYEASMTFPTREEAESFLYEGKSHQVHTLDITPNLRKAALSQGFPLFAIGGMIAPNLIPVDYDPFSREQRPRGRFPALPE
jgi:hypothetical protein